MSSNETHGDKQINIKVSLSSEFTLANENIFCVCVFYYKSALKQIFTKPF